LHSLRSKARSFRGRITYTSKACVRDCRTRAGTPSWTLRRVGSARGRGNPKGKDAEQGTTMAELLVCKHGDIAEGGVRIVRDGALEIGVIHHGGHYYAYRNHCPHQGGPACEGLRMPQIKELIDEQGVYHGKTFDETDMHIVCPWHGYEFHLSDGVHVADKRIRLQKFKVIERDGDVYVAV
jgi:nitrite reductase/ring-hydroxylating ferredoxin subunit